MASLSSPSGQLQHSDTSFQVVILAGGQCKRLYPLTSGGGGGSSGSGPAPAPPPPPSSSPAGAASQQQPAPPSPASTSKALLCVANRPLLSYPLRNLADAGIKQCIVVALGEAVEASISSFLAQQEAAGGVACQLITVGEECGTADALRAVAPQLRAPSVVVYSGDTITDLPLRALLLEHQVSGALATVVVGDRRTSPASETKPGKPPRGVDYLGLDLARRLLLFAASSPEALRDLRVPLAGVEAGGAGGLSLHTDMVDQHLYVLSRPALKLLAAQPQLSSLKLDFIPWLTQHATRAAAAAAAQAASSDARLLGGGRRGAGGLARGGAGGGGAVSPAEAALARHGSGFLLAGGAGMSSGISGGGGGGIFAGAAAAAAAASAAAAAAASGGGAAPNTPFGAAAAAAAAAAGDAGAAPGSAAGAGAGAAGEQHAGGGGAAAAGGAAAGSAAGSIAGDTDDAASASAAAGAASGAGGLWGVGGGLGLDPSSPCPPLMGLPGVLTGLGLPGEGYMALSHAGPAAAAAGAKAGRVGVALVPPGRYCARVNSVAAFGEVNRDVAASDIALRLTGLTPSKYDNVVPPSVSLGAKATVGPACIVGEGCVLGDKTSVKRSVIGNNCRLGGGVKVINSVLMDGVTIGDGGHVQNCVVCSGAVVQERAALKDCQVGPGFVVVQASEHKSETLART